MDARYVYPRIRVDELPWATNKIKNMFQIDKVINPCPQKLCLSASLFEMNQNKILPELFESKYLAELVNNIKRLPEIGSKYKLRLYLAANLHGLIDTLLKLQSNQLEIYLMKENSPSENPGAMWRFLALSDKSLDIVGVTDIDEPMTTIYIDRLHTSSKKLCKQSANDPQLHVRDGIFFGQYHLFQAGRFAMRPSSVPDLNDIYDVMCRFIQYAQDGMFTDPITIFNVPRPGHPYGWGRNVHAYGFDETFLKCVLYPCMKQDDLDFIGIPSQLEIDFIKEGS